MTNPGVAFNDQIAFCCPWCGQFARVPARFAGRKGRCLSCKGRVLVTETTVEGPVSVGLPQLRYLAR